MDNPIYPNQKKKTTYKTPTPENNSRVYDQIDALNDLKSDQNQVNKAKDTIAPLDIQSQIRLSRTETKMELKNRDTISEEGNLIRHHQPKTKATSKV